MPVMCQAVIDAMEKLAPAQLAEAWDNVGLIIGKPNQEVSKILVTLDVDEAITDQAITSGIHMIIAHHPFLFKGITKVRTDQPAGRILSKILQADIAVFAAHTNLDIADGGVNDVLADKLGLRDTKPLKITTADKLRKLVVFVPKSHVEEVRSAMTMAGAGHIGNYSHCTFQTSGTGTFFPLAGTNPYLGKQGQLEYADEYRLETIIPEKLSHTVISAMIKAHPYEEVAYDEYPLLNAGAIHGLGRIGRIAAPVSLRKFADDVKQALGIPYVVIAGDADKNITQVAVCGGSGAALIPSAAAAGADVLVTGDVKYHEAQEAVANDLAIIDAGHFPTENLVIPGITNYLRQCARQANWDVEIIFNTISNNVLSIY
ncbi:MAG TPA: Nif3-like dinuclear metal center hexameric protein [Methylomusa anaerophila]|uniref:GTP cyclohydrolase 1 type 2 homolog n=1 Tax=Methylomusa anaerophila TaxID=1930071 RepID=A0A348AP10_9FIRM|nr:Nif3-like dinuclear metal center hexameric protein [Methylomusa anaerophila]BBB92808.1 putative GTP cyclohydrolase 1 type 2 [Methylomusa anaerophila]HML90720.1 Nif3-like dinuclear metal center hexameric protein [Methylomusa anaerophila]